MSTQLPTPHVEGQPRSDESGRLPTGWVSGDEPAKSIAVPVLPSVDTGAPEPHRALGCLTLESSTSTPTGAIQARILDCPNRHRGVLRAAYEKRASPRKAIQAFCLQCLGYSPEAIRECSARACPLWRYRPYQRDRNDDV